MRILKSINMAFWTMLFCVFTTISFSEFVVAQESSTAVEQVSPKLLFIDVRTPDEFKVDGVAPAINVEYQNISKVINSLSKGKKDIEIKLYCRSGRRASIALKTLEQLGYTNVVNLGTVTDAKTYIKSHPVK